MRLERLATRFQKRGQTVDRAIEVDICYPQDLAEYDRLAGHAIVLLSAVTRTERQLPLQRVYVSAGGVETPHVSIGGVRLDALSRAAKSVLGGYREDRFYLAPVSALSQDGAALADRAGNRTGFRVHQSPSRAPEGTRTAAAPPDAKPDPAAVAAVLKREYPGYDIR